MKMNQLVFPLVFALAATLATTGCKKGPVKTTIIPGHNALVGGPGEGPGTLPPGTPFASALAASASDKLLIEGHCDERGTEEYNRSLGERRALALREALAKAGVSPDRVRTLSYGKDKPADPGHDESAWSKNRRGEFILLHPKAGA
jgi:hypothetical protein